MINDLKSVFSLEEIKAVLSQAYNDFEGNGFEKIFTLYHLSREKGAEFFAAFPEANTDLTENITDRALISLLMMSFISAGVNAISSP